MRSKKWLGMLSSVGLPLLFGVVIFVLWQTQILHSWMGTDTITLPLPTRIGEIISQNNESIGSQIKMTLIVALGGLVAGSLLGYLIAVIATIFRKWGAGGLTIVSAFNAIPIVALAPVINNWTRDVSNEVSVRSTMAKIIVVTISCTAAMSVNMDETAMQQTLDLAKQYIILEDSAAKDALASMTLDDIRSTAYLTYDPATDGAPEKTSVSVQLKWLPQAQFMGYYVADAKGYYDEVGLDVEIISGGGDISETTAVYNGTVDFGVTSGKR